MDKQHVLWRTYALLIQSDLLGEALLGEVAHSIVVCIGEKMGQVVLRLGILLQPTATIRLCLYVKVALGFGGRWAMWFWQCVETRRGSQEV